MSCKNHKVARLLLMGLLLTGTAGTLGCDTWDEFRTVAGPNIETGVNAFVDGILDGLFAVFEPDEDISDNGGTD